MRQSSFETSRIAALSDGVFAIAMTLLVLDLKLPDVGKGLPTEIFWATLTDQGPRFLSWLLSFAILCRLWVTQHSLLTGGDRRSRPFVGWDFLFLGMISFLPFSTSLLSEHHDQWLSVCFVSANLGVSGIALFGMAKCLFQQDPSVGRSSFDEGLAKRAVLILLLTAVGSTGVAFWNPPIGASVWIAFPVVATLLEVHPRTHVLDKRSGEN